MKRLFIYLLKKYSKSEEERLEILSILNEKVQETYTEQSVYGNIYNFYIEFIISLNVIRDLVKNDNQDHLDMIKRGIDASYEESIEWIKKDKMYEDN